MLRIKDNFGYIIAVSIIEVINRFLFFVLPISVSWLLEGVFDSNKIALVFLIVFLSFLLNIITVNLQKKTVIKFKQKLNLDLYNQLFHLKYSALNEKGMIYYLEKINLAVVNYSNYVLYNIPQFIGVILTMAVSWILISRINLLMMILCVLAFFLQVISMKYLNQALVKKSEKLQSESIRSFSNIISVVQCVDYIKQLPHYKGINNIVSKDVQNIHEINTDVDTYAKNVSNLISTLIINIKYSFYIFLGILTVNQLNTPSSFLVGVMIISICFDAYVEFTSLSINSKDMKASKRFIEQEIMNQKEMEGSQNLSSSIDKIEFKNTKIGYENNVLIDQLNLIINKGDIIWLKGETGLGKSSLVKAILKFYNVLGLKINDEDIHKFSLESLRSRISYISQNHSIVNGSVEDNIVMGNDSGDFSNLVKLKFIQKFVENKELKKLHIQANGSNLSGGDKQRIEVARLFVENPDVLILDEITSSLDTMTSRLVYDEIVSRFSEKIIIIISHDELACEYANRIVEIKNHQAVEINKN